MFVCSIELGTSELTNKKQLLLLHFSMRSSCVWAICAQIRMYSRIRIALFDVRKEQRQKKWKSSCLHATAARLTIMILSFPCSFGERHWLLSIRYTIYIFMAFYLLALFFFLYLSLVRCQFLAIVQSGSFSFIPHIERKLECSSLCSNIFPGFFGRKMDRSLLFEASFHFILTFLRFVYYLFDLICRKGWNKT